MIVITGGAGFIGSAVVRVLNDRGIKDIVIVDNLGTTNKWKNLVGKHFSELLLKEQLFEWLEGKEDQIQAIIHLGACSSTIETDANYLLSNNTHFSQRLALYALEAGIRFIYASSAATFGDGRFGFSDSEEILETLCPLNMYGYSKHLFDLWLKNRNLLDRVVGLKYFNVYGPNEYHKGRMSSAVLKMVPQIQEKGKVELFKSLYPNVFKDGEQKRDFIYVKDAARMTIQFLDNEKTGLFNIGSGQAESWRSLAEAAIEALGCKAAIEFVEVPKELAGIYQSYTCAEMDKTEQQDLLMAEYSLQEGVREYVRDYILQNRYW